MFKRLALIFFGLLIAGCESDYEKCLSAETEKAKVTLTALNPVLATYARINNFERTELETIFNLADTAYSQAGGPTRCKNLEDLDNCVSKINAARTAALAILKDAGYGDAFSLIEGGKKALRDSDDREPLETLVERYSSSAKKTFEASNKTSGDRVEFELEKIEGETRAVFEFYELEKLLLKAPAVASEICNSRGLYE